MGYQESLVKFKDMETLKNELRRYEKKGSVSDLVEIICVDRVKKEIPPFKEGELVAVVGGERSEQRDKVRLKKGLGIKNIAEIVFIDNPYYWEVAETQEMALRKFLEQHFEILSDEEYKELLQ